MNIRAGAYGGSGVIRANGGGMTNDLVAGGGGRIAINYEDNSGVSGRLEARGGGTNNSSSSYMAERARSI